MYLMCVLTKESGMSWKGLVKTIIYVAVQMWADELVNTIDQPSHGALTTIITIMHLLASEAGPQLGGGWKTLYCHICRYLIVVRYIYIYALIGE